MKCPLLNIILYLEYTQKYKTMNKLKKYQKLLGRISKSKSKSLERVIAFKKHALGLELTSKELTIINSSSKSIEPSNFSLDKINNETPN